MFNTLGVCLPSYKQLLGVWSNTLQCTNAFSRVHSVTKHINENSLRFVIRYIPDADKLFPEHSINGRRRLGQVYADSTVARLISFN